MDRLSNLLDYEDTPDLISLRSLSGQRVILIGFEDARAHGIASLLAGQKCLSRSVTYTELTPEHPDLGLADIIVLNWSEAITVSPWSRPRRLSGLSVPLLVAGSPDGLNAVALPELSNLHSSLEIGDDTRIIRSIQELLVKADDGRAGLDGAVEAATIRVLAIDDDPDMRLLIRTILRGFGFESHFASDGRPGVKMARRIMPNLILLDINMPGASGFDVLSAIRHEPGTSTSLVMLLSGCNSEADIRKGRLLHADDYVMKPFSALSLTTRIRKLLG